MKKELIDITKNRIWFIAVFFLSLILYKLAFLFPEATEKVYSRAIYPFFANIFSSITSVFPFSLAEIGLYTFFIAVVFFIIYIPLGALRKGKRLLTVLKRFFTFLCVISTIASAFILNWAINYARVPLKYSMGIETSVYSAEQLKEVSIELVNKANSLRDQVAQDENGVFKLSSSRDEILKQVAKVYEQNAPEYMRMVSSGARAKGVFTKNLLSYLETTGIYSPFTYEANLNMQMPESFFPSTVAHEYAHLQGFAREDEANFISWYVSRNSENKDFAYSAYLLALTYSLNSLYTASKQYHAEVYEMLSDGIKRDFAANNSYWDEFDTEFSEQANSVYSDYLKASGVEDGNKSYGRMLDLILGMHEMGLSL